MKLALLIEKIMLNSVFIESIMSVYIYVHINRHNVNIAISL